MNNLKTYRNFLNESIKISKWKDYTYKDYTGAIEIKLGNEYYRYEFNDLGIITGFKDTVKYNPGNALNILKMNATNTYKWVNKQWKNLNEMIEVTPNISGFINEYKRLTKFKYKKYDFSTRSYKEAISTAYDFGQLILIPEKVGSNIYGKIIRKIDDLECYHWNDKPVDSIKIMLNATEELENIIDWDNLVFDNLTIDEEKKLKQNFYKIMKKYGGSFI